MAVSQEQVDQWFVDNPNATPDEVAKAVQSIGGLEANQGLAGMIANRYSIAEPEVTNYYNKFAAPSGGISNLVTPPAEKIATTPSVTTTAIEPVNDYVENTAATTSPTVAKTPTAADLLAQKILAQNTASKWTGEGFGSAEANAADMAKILASIGITDIKDFGKITKKIPASSYETEQGTVEVPEQTITTYGNKVTGQEVPNTYSERQTGNFFGGTFTGKGNTGYGVQFDAQGNPYFYTAGASSNDLANLMQDLGPIGNIALAVATGGLSIPEQLAVNAALQLASGKDIGDIAKGTAASYLGSQIPGLDVVKDATSVLNGIDSTGILSSAAQNAAISGAKALVLNQNVGDAMLAGAAAGGTNGAVNALLDNVEGFKDLTPAQKKMAVNAVTGVISGKPLDQIVVNTAISVANNAVKEAKVNKTADASDVIDTLKTAGLTEGNTTLDNITSPTGVQLAAADTGTTSDAGNGVFRTTVGGVPTYAESSNASTVNAPFGYRLMSTKEADNRPAGSYYDITANAWFAPAEEVTKLTNLDNIQNDINLFKSSTGDIQDIAASTSQTSDDELASLLKYAGIKNVGQLINSGLTTQDIIDLANSKTTPTTDGVNKTTPSVTPPTPEVPELVITDEKPVPELVITDNKTPVTSTPTITTTPVVTPPVVTPPVVTPPVVTPPVVKPPVVTPPVVTPPVVKPPVVTPPVVTPPVSPTVKSKSTGYTMPQAESIAAAFGMPALANVFYYGKDFSSKKQKLDKKGELQDEEYKALSVTAPGAIGELVEEQKTKENNANDALDLIFGESSESMSVDDLLNIVKGG